MDLTNNDTNPDENHQDNGATLPHVTQPSSPHSPLTYASVSLEPPPLLPQVDGGAVVHLAGTVHLLEVRLKAANDMLFGAY